MKGSQRVIEQLNEVLTSQLTAINQYFLHARMTRNWGYGKLAKKTYDASIDVMKYASKITDRVLFLEGVPNLQKLLKLNIGETVPEQLESDRKFVQDSITRYKNAIKVCFEEADHASRELLEHMLEEEEEYLDWLESQLGIVKDVGLENYLAQMIDD